MDRRDFVAIVMGGATGIGRNVSIRFALLDAPSGRRPHVDQQASRQVAAKRLAGGDVSNLLSHWAR